MTDPVRRHRLLAVAPFLPLGEGDNARRHAEFCQGLSLFVVRRLGNVAGMAVRMATPTETEPGHHAPPPGAEPPPESMPAPVPPGAEDNAPTHLLRAEASWDVGATMHLRVHMLDIAENRVRLNVVKAPAEEALGRLYSFVGAVGAMVAGSDGVGHLLARPSTDSPAALRLFLCALAARENWARGLADPERAYAYLLRALKEDLQFREALAVLDELAEACLGDDDPRALKDSLAALDDAIRLLPREPSLRGWLALFLLRAERPDEAEKYLRSAATALRTGGLAARLYVELARIEQRRGRQGPAQRLLRSAANASPGDPAPLAELGDLHWQAGQVGHAADAWLKALQENPDDIEVLVKLARLHLEQHAASKAIVLAERALGISDDHAPALRLAALAHHAMGNLAAADAHATALVELTTPGFDAWWLLARVRHSRGDTAAAAWCRTQAMATARTQAEVLAVDEQDIPTEARRAATLGPVGSPDRHARLLRLVEKYPRSPWVCLHLAESHEARGENLAALDYRGRLVSATPHDPATAYDHALRCFALGRVRQAWESVQQVVLRDPEFAYRDRLAALRDRHARPVAPAAAAVEPVAVPAAEPESPLPGTPPSPEAAASPDPAPSAAPWWRRWLPRRRGAG